MTSKGKFHSVRCVKKTVPVYSKRLCSLMKCPKHLGPRWTKVGIDLFEYNKQQYLLVVDYYSKFPYMHRLHSPNTSTIINKLKEIFAENGIAETVIRDGRHQFRSEFKEFAKKWNFSIYSLHLITTNQMDKEKDLYKL